MLTSSQTSGPEATERIQYLDALRVLAMLAVVFLHSSTATLGVGDGSAVWHFSNVITSLFNARVPLFFMVSGALLLDSPRTLSIAYTLKKRVLRLLVPLLVWSILYLAYQPIADWVVGGSPDWAGAIDKLKTLLGRPAIVPLWFMYAMICVYILSPLLKGLVDSLSRNLAIFMMALWVVFSCLLPTVAALVPDYLSSSFTLMPNYDFNFIAGYLGYFLAGYYLMKTKKSVPKKWLILAICINAAVIALGTWWKTDVLGFYSDIFKRHTYVFTVIMACSLFLLFKELMRERRLGRVASRVIGFLTPLTFGVYLAHSLMVALFTSWSPIRSIGLLIAYYLAELTASILLVAALSNIKLLSYAFVGRPYRAWRWRARRKDDARARREDR